MAIRLQSDREVVWFALEAIHAELEVEPSPDRLRQIRMLQAAIAQAAIDPDPSALRTMFRKVLDGLEIDLGLYIGRWPEWLTYEVWQIIRRSNRWLEVAAAGGDALADYLARALELERRREWLQSAREWRKAQEARNLWWATGRQPRKPSLVERQHQRSRLATLRRLRSRTTNAKYRAIADAILVERIYSPTDIISAKGYKWSDWQGFQRMARRMSSAET
jgi:hypothetical protein